MLPLHIDANWFRDAAGRFVLLRGVNLGGSNKLPVTPDGATNLLESLSEGVAVSFIGRPFPLGEADEHFGRLRAWGFNILRFVITWEAIEHAGPGIYDEAYLDWFAELVGRAGEYGLYVFVDFHQDVWGRWSGGDGAPLWTYTMVGLEPSQFDATDAAVTMQRRYPDDYPQMTWGTNYSRFAASTMFTLFFGGDDFAPTTFISDEPVQQFLQRHFLDAAAQVAQRVRDFAHVIGYGPFNEPHGGYIGLKLDETPAYALPGPRPTPYDCMLAAAGFARTVPVYTFVATQQVRTGTRLFNPEGYSAWQDGTTDIWQAEGVWRIERGVPELLRPDYFQTVDGREVTFADDYLKPFIGGFAERIRAIHPGALLFIENEPLRPESFHWVPGDPTDIVNASHWYDAATLYTKRFISFASVDVYETRAIFGQWAITEMFSRQMGILKKNSQEHLGNCPTLIGEFGLPFDLNDREGYRTGDFSNHSRLLEMYYNAIDELLLNATQWVYTADNSNEWGDLWNREDLSIFSRDQQRDPTDINSGGRGLEGFCRPYARRTAGEPTHMAFDRTGGTFELRYMSDSTISAPTELFIPKIQYPNGYEIELSSGQARHDEAAQLLFVEGAEAGEQRIVVRRRG